jgi:hypothetical protein
MSGMRHIASRDNAQFKALRALADDPRGHGSRHWPDGIHLVATCFPGVGIRQLLVSERRAETCRNRHPAARRGGELIA